MGSEQRERKEEVPAQLADKCTKGQKTERERDGEGICTKMNNVMCVLAG
jgi:hypothetical protein